MKLLLSILLFFIPLFAGAQFTVPQGGTGLTTVANGAITYGSSTLRLSSDSLFFWDESANRLGIGSSSPSHELTIESNDPDIRLMDANTPAWSNISGDAGNLTFNNSSGNRNIIFQVASSEKMRITSGGFVGIATSSLSSGMRLTVGGNSYFGGNVTATGTLTVENDTSLQEATSTQFYSGVIGLNSEYFTDFTGNGLVNLSGVLSVSTSSLSTSFYVQDGNSFGTTAVLGTSDAFNLQFETGGATKMTIVNSTGFVGIGTTTPSTLLDIFGGDVTLANNQSYRIRDTGFTARTVMIVTTANNLVYGNTALGDVLFNTGGLGSAMTIASSSGNVGIGSTTPAQRLSVQGNALIAGSLTAGNILATGTLTVLGNTSLQQATTTQLFSSLASSTQLFATNATTSSLFTNVFRLDGDSITDLTGAGLTVINGALTVSTTSSGFFIQNGNSFGTTAVLGTNDAFQLNFETSGTVRASLDTTGRFGLGSSSPQSRLVVQQSAEFTAYNPADVDGQLDKGTTAFLYNEANSNNAFSQLVFKQRQTSTAISRIVSIVPTTGSSALTFVNSNGSVPFEAARLGFSTTTATTPLFTLNGDTNTGLNPIAADEWSMNNNGIETLRFTAMNEVGIGTTSPFSKLSLVGGSLLQMGGDNTTPYVLQNLGGFDVGVAVGVSGTGGQGIEVHGQTAYFVTASSTAGGTGCTSTDFTDCEFFVMDVSSTSPRYLGGANLGTGGTGVTVAGRYAYVANQSVTGTGCTSTDPTSCEFRIYDVSNRTSPTYMGGLNFGATGNSIVVAGKYAYIGHGSNTGTDFKIIDISDPRNPIIVGGLDLGGSGLGIRVRGNYAYIAQSTAAGNDFKIVDISNPTAPVVVGGVDVATNARAVYVQGNYAYLGKDNTGIDEDFIVYDISNPASPATTTAIDFSIAVQSINVSGRYVYVGNTSSVNEIRVFDNFNPYSLVQIGTADVGNNNALNMFVQGTRMYVGGSNAAVVNEFRIYDVLGADLQSLFVGTVEAGTGQFRGAVNVLGGLTADSVNVGTAGIFTRGPLGVGATTTIMGGYLGVGTTSPTSTIHASAGAGTTTVTIGELNLTTSKSCINMNTATGAPASMFVDTTGALTVELKYCIR